MKFKFIFGSIVVVCLLSLFLVPMVYSNSSPTYKVIEVKDGDTIVIEHPDTFYQNPSIRLYGVDTPESYRPKCDLEKQMGEKAKQFIKTTLKSNKNIITLGKIDKDKYGRILTTVYVDGKDLSKLLIKNGLAREYFGDKKQSWCN